MVNKKYSNSNDSEFDKKNLQELNLIKNIDNHNNNPIFANKLQENFIINNNMANEIIEKKYTTNKYLSISPDTASPDLFFNKTEIIIDEFGLKNCPNTKANKFTFFGVDETNEGGNYQNQILINLQDNIKSELNSLSQSGKKLIKNYHKKKFPIFYVYYDNSVNLYAIKSLTNDVYFSFLIPPTYQLELDYIKKNFLKFGKVILLIGLDKETENINIKVKKGISIQKEITQDFKFSDLPISIGRENCNLIIPCKSVSKTHVSISRNFNNQSKIILVDNYSTNGSQLLLQEGKIFYLESDMKFYLGTKQFLIKIKNT